MTTTQDLEMSITVNNSHIQATLVQTVTLNLLLNLRCVQTFHSFAYYVSHFLPIKK